MDAEITIRLFPKRQVRALPFFAYFWPAVFLAIAGILDSAYLAWSHYRNYTDIGYQSFCAITKALNCDTVSQSAYAIFLNVPVAVWGGIGYLVFLVMLLSASKDSEHRRPWTVLFIAAFAFSLISVVLSLVSSFKVHSYCIMCIASYAINFALLFNCWIVRRRFGAGGLLTGARDDIKFLFRQRSQTVLLGVVVPSGLCLLLLFFPQYWHYENTQRNVSIPTGVTEDGSPWIGARNPSLVITEYADYMCFQCGKMNAYLHQLVTQYPDKLRLVHKQFPLDRRYNFTVREAIHPDSGKVALFAIFAATEGKFWEVNDALFRQARETGIFKLDEIAEKFDLDIEKFKKMARSGELISKLKQDVVSGWETGVNSTPSYVIDGTLFRGVIPKEVLSKIKGSH